MPDPAARPPSRPLPPARPDWSAWVDYPCLPEYTPARDAVTRRRVAAAVRAVCARGASLAVGQGLEPGTQVELSLAAPGRRLLRRARVLHARPRGETWLVVCEFHEPLGDAELQELAAAAPALVSLRAATA